MPGDYVKRSDTLQAVGDIHPLDYNGQGIVERIKAIPAADVVEVRHERWDLAKDPFGAGYVKCSRCGYKHCPEYYPDGSAIMHLFCPSCGAKMDGGQDDV